MAGTTYASATQLAAYLGTAAPADATRLLRRATDTIKYLTHAQVPVPDNPDSVPVVAAHPTDAEQRQIACRNAVCALVEEWVWYGERPTANQTVKARTIGKYSETFDTTVSGGALDVPSRVLQYLDEAGVRYAGAGVIIR